MAGRGRRQRRGQGPRQAGRGGHLAKLHGPAAVDQALGAAALAGRFGDGDLLAILTHQRGGLTAEATRAGEAHSLQPATGAWARLGTSSSGSSGGGQVP